MTIHLIKLCVGVDSVSHLERLQARRLKEARKQGTPEVLRHVTRNTPRRDSALLDGGSLYWVIRGFVRARQPLRALQPTMNARGQPACALILDPALIRVAARPWRAFQGWRYLEANDAPSDAVADSEGGIPEDMAEELRRLGLI